MLPDSKQETLDRLLGDLQSDEQARCLSALHELGTLRYSSPAVLREVERLAIHHAQEEVREQACQSLDWPVHRLIRSKISRLPRGDRYVILKQIEQWEQEGLIEADRSVVIRKRYDFDAVPYSTATPPAAHEEESPAVPPAPQPLPAGPPASLTQTLLSEASIKVYLYLGAFFVIASALILAAVLEAARLPILAVATAAFGAAALTLRKRLPQPSFALFIVFSFLLPIAANVLEETAGFRGSGLDVYWTLVFLLMSAIWGFSVWLYGSRFFSLVAFLALSLAFYRAAQIFNVEWQYLLGMLASLAGLAGTSVLSKWKNREFSVPVFLLSQLQAGALLFASLAFNLDRILGDGLLGEWWLLMGMTWIAAALFYAWSDRLRPGLLFPWLAVGVLLPLPWFILQSIDPSRPQLAVGTWVWGSVLALASEGLFRNFPEKSGGYRWPLLAGSLPLFLVSQLLAVRDGRPGLVFMLFASTALVYGAMHLLRPRWYLWSAALLAGIFAFFTLFRLPDVEPLQIPFVFQVLAASLVLVGPELLTRSPLSFRSMSRVPAIVLGAVLSILGIALALVDLQNPGRGAVVLLVYAASCTLHGLHGKREWLGYCAGALVSLAVLYLLDHYYLDLWLPAMNGLALAYYIAGFLLRQRRPHTGPWGGVLVNSGLALGILVSAFSLLVLKETSGWYALLIALLFAVELFARPLAWLEPVVEALLSLALYLILHDFRTTSIAPFLFGASLIWLGGDLAFGRWIREKRPYRPALLAAGYGLVALSTLFLWDTSSAVPKTLYSLGYAVFFVLSAIWQREPRLGYLAAAFLGLAVIPFSEILAMEKWVFPAILLSTAFYAAGYWLRRNRRLEGWNQMLLQSGLVLGLVSSVAAPLQGRLDTSIPVALAATLFAAEAFARRDVWWALPADMLYLLAYFMILAGLKVEEPQFYSIGAALLGMLMHSLLTRAGSRTGAFVAGMLSQLVLLGTTYIQMLSTEELSFFFVLFAQSMLILIYGLIQRSRSLVVTPIAFAVLGVMTVVYSALKGLGPVILIGSTGLLLLLTGIVAVLMRERITKLGEQLGDWRP